MILNNEDAIKRLNSPMNLINRLKDSSSRKNAMSLFIKPEGIEVAKKIDRVKDFNPFQNKPAETLPETPLEQPSKLEDILENHESQIKLGLAHDKSLDLLTRSVDLLAIKLDDIKADRLPQVVTAASKVVESIRKERNESIKQGKDREVHFHFYTPEQKVVSNYEIIDVAG